MVFQPHFVLRRQEYEADKQRVRTLSDWLAFRRKWFDDSDWPWKRKEQIEAESRVSGGPFRLGGRTWGHVSYAHDLSPEARYEYFFTSATLGDPLHFPDDAAAPKTPENGWTQECRYCEIWTRQVGNETCPRCGRKLIYVRLTE